LQDGETIASWIIEHNSTQSIVFYFFLKILQPGKTKKGGCESYKGTFLRNSGPNSPHYEEKIILNLPFLENILQQVAIL
jgi:hypothetical protein